MAFQGSSQQLSHFRMGERELADVNVYSLLQHESGKLLIATNNGLYTYYSGQFKHIEKAQDQHGLALFDLTKDKNGRVFCVNLNGQIFKWDDEKQSLSLYLTIPSHLLNKNLTIEFDSDNSLWIGCKGIIKHDGERLSVVSENPRDEVFNMNQSYQGPGDICVTTRRLDTLAVISDGNLKYLQTPYPKKDIIQNNSSVSLLYLANNPFIFHRNGKYISLSDTNARYKSTFGGKVNQLDTNEVWLMGSVGTSTITFHNDSAIQSQTYFPTEFISCAHKNKNGTVILGTFGNGIIVIPDMYSLYTEFTRYRPMWITGNEDNQYVITQTGQIHQFYKAQHSGLIDSLVQATQIFYFEKYKIDSITGSTPGLYHPFNHCNDKLTGVSGLKSLVEVQHNTLLASGASGVYKLGDGLSSFVWNQQGNSSWNKLASVNKRCNEVVFWEAESALYIAGNQKLYVKYPDKKEVELKFKGNSISVSDLEMFGDKLVCATIDNGVLIFENNELIAHISKKDGLNENRIRRLQIKDNVIYLLAGDGIQLIRIDDNKIRSLGAFDGVVAEIIRDFIICQNRIYFITDFGLHSILRQDFFINNQAGNLILQSVFVNDNETTARSFNHRENQLVFNLGYSDFEYQSDLKIKYRLSGLEKKWIFHPSIQNPIEYKSLSPGAYTLEIIPSINGVSGERITYKFEIRKPYWNRLWFYALLVVLAILVFYLIYRLYYRWNMRRERIKSELSASKLTAIQSQMNPHFIFNALNSIQDLVLKGDKKNSYTYITKFAGLVRKTLNYSDKDLIELHQEVKLIELYLTIEQLRFKEDFEYELDYPEIEVLVPPMIVQPFIENALVHGLLHKDGLRKLNITFELKETLYCEITDNGIGREMAEKIKKRQRGEDHESFSVSANNKRFKILSELYEGQFGYTYVDLIKDGEPCGTKVILMLPIVRKF